MQGVSQEMRNDPQFKQAQKRFFQNDVSDTASQFNAAQAKFFDGGANGRLNAANTVGDKFQNVQDCIVPANGQRYNNDKAAFFGADADARSTGSAFMANTAAFYGQEKPKPGFSIKAGAAAPQTSNVNAKSGVFRKDAAAFYGDDKFEVESQGTQFQ